MTAANIRKFVARAGESAKLGLPAHPHMIRNACGYKLADDGHDTRALQNRLGHRSIQRTVRYTDMAPDRFQGFWRDLALKVRVSALPDKATPLYVAGDAHRGFPCRRSGRMALHTKSVWSPIDKQNDGIRILATRMPGRYVRKSRYDLWMPNLAPSESILTRLQAGKLSWEKFLELYEQELASDGGGQLGNHRFRNHGQKHTLRLLKVLSRRGHHVTLMCHCDEDEQHCHRHTLRKLVLHEKL